MNNPLTESARYFVTDASLYIGNTEPIKSLYVASSKAKSLNIELVMMQGGQKYHWDRKTEPAGWKPIWDDKESEQLKI